MLKVNQKKRIKLKEADGYLHAEPDIEDALSREVSRQKTLLQYNRQQANKSSGSDLVRLDDSIGSADFHRERRRSSIIMFARDELFINFRELSCSESCYRKNAKLMQMHSDLSADKTRTGSKSNKFVIRQVLTQSWSNLLWIFIAAHIEMMMSTGEIPSLSHVTYKNIFYWKKIVRKNIQSRKSTSAFWQNLHTIQQRTWMQRFWLILNVAINLIPLKRKRTMLLERRANKCKQEQVVSYHICSLKIILKWILKISRFQLHSQNEILIFKRFPRALIKFWARDGNFWASMALLRAKTIVAISTTSKTYVLYRFLPLLIRKSFENNFIVCTPRPSDTA